MANRYQDAEQLAEATRAEIPRVAVQWLAAARDPLEKLTMAAMNPALSDAEFLALVETFSTSLPGLLETMDHDALAKLMEDGMGAGVANGIAERQKTARQKTEEKRAKLQQGEKARNLKHEIRNEEKRAKLQQGEKARNLKHEIRNEEKRAKLPWEAEVWLGGNKNHDSKNGRFTHGAGGSAVKLSGQRWEGGTKAMHKRAAEALHEMKSMMPFQHPESKVEMKVTADGIRKSLHDMRSPEEFMAAARFREIFLHSTKKGGGESDRKMRHGIKAFHRFETQVAFGKQRHTVEIITKELDGSPVHHLKQIRFKK